MSKLIPGTKKEFKNVDAYNDFKKMIDLTDGLTLSQVKAITGLDTAMIQNWVKRKYVARPINKKYYEKHVARILLINSLKDALRIEDIGTLMKLVNGDVEDESDDLLHEGDLYNLFTRVYYNLDDYQNLDKVIAKELKRIKRDDKKLILALKIMINAHIASAHKKAACASLKELANYSKRRK